MQDIKTLAFNFKHAEAKRELELINNSLENIEDGMRSNNKIQICAESKKASTSINANLNGLKRLEPDYNWREIKEVLDKLSRNNCKI